MAAAAVPTDLEITHAPREPILDPTMGVPLAGVERRGEPPHRLVTIGDSLTHGFQSGSVFHTDVSYPAIVAYELGWLDRFRYPRYAGAGGLPLNIELLLRDLEQGCGRALDWWDVPVALFRGREFMDRVEDYWERGPGSVHRPLTAINHNLAVYGWDLRDVLDRTGKSCQEAVLRPKDDLLRQAVENANDRAALRVYPMTGADSTLTLLDAATRLGEQGEDSEAGIETLVIFLGANNALGSVVSLEVVWSEDPGYTDLEKKGRYTVWRPAHFRHELNEVAAAVRRIKARHVIWCTVPHVTIVPIARGVGGKVDKGSRYFPFYTRPWIGDSQFDPGRDPHITGAEARQVDSAIDAYNDAIAELVGEARAGENPRDWYLLDIAGLLDRLAQRRYIEDPQARPDWWQPYPLPAQLRVLTPPPDSRFLSSDGNGRRSGGLFSLDGVHPTTVGYGLVAQELINVMRVAGVEFRTPGGRVRRDPVTVDFDRLIRRDTLINTPPDVIDSGLGILAWADEALDLVRRALTFRS